MVFVTYRNVVGCVCCRCCRVSRSSSLYLRRCLPRIEGNQRSRLIVQLVLLQNRAPTLPGCSQEPRVAPMLCRIDRLCLPKQVVPFDEESFDFAQSIASTAFFVIVPTIPRCCRRQVWQVLQGKHSICRSLFVD